MLYNSFKQKAVAIVTGLCLFIAVAGAAGIAADALGLAVTPSVSACSPGSGGGGEC